MKEPVSGKLIEEFIKKKGWRSRGIEIFEPESEGHFRPDRSYHVIVVRGEAARAVRDAASMLRDQFGGILH